MRATMERQRGRIDPTRGRCQFCPETWDPGTDVSGWELDRATGRWVTCPGCARYRREIAKAYEEDRGRYWAWFSCKCGAFDQDVVRWRECRPGCPSAGTLGRCGS